MVRLVDKTILIVRYCPIQWDSLVQFSGLLIMSLLGFSYPEPHCSLLHTLNILTNTHSLLIYWHLSCSVLLTLTSPIAHSVISWMKIWYLFSMEHFSFQHLLHLTAFGSSWLLLALRWQFLHFIESRMSKAIRQKEPPMGSASCAIHKCYASDNTIANTNCSCLWQDVL